MHSTCMGRFGVALAGALLVLAGCDRDSDPVDHTEMHSLVVIDRGASGTPEVAWWERGVGWAGALPVQNLATHERLSLGFRIYDEDGDEMPLTAGGEFFIRYFVRDDPEGIIHTDRPNAELFHGDHVHVYGQQVGTAMIEFEQWHVDHEEWTTDEIEYTVIDEAVDE